MPDPEIKSTENTPAPGDTKADVSVVNVNAGQQQQVGEALVDQKPAETGPKMPEGGHEKYWNSEKGEYNWEAHARELAWQQDQKTSQQDTQAEKEATAEADKAAAEVAQAAGVNIEEFNAYVAEHGEPSPEHLKIFEAAGIPTDAVKDYVKLKVEQADRHVDAVTEFIGGEQALSALNQHLVKNYTKEEIVAFNEQLMNPATWRATASYLLGDAGMARSGRGLIKGPNAQAPAQSGETFKTEAEFNSAMRDPRYKTDPAYREKVQSTLRNSPHLMGR